MRFSNISQRSLAGTLAVATVGVLSIIGWSVSAAQQAANPPFMPLNISINALMADVVDDTAHDVWEGGNKSAPLTANEWLEIGEHATQIQAVATLVSLGGTGQADRGWVVSPAWQDWSRKLRDAGVTVKRAVDTKNQMALRSAADALTTVCEGCHKQFKPDLPTEGILHKGHAPK